MGRPRSAAGRARETNARLGRVYPGSAGRLCPLHHGDTFQLLVATILSAQCTDSRVNEVTPVLFEAWPGPEDLAAADRGRLEEVIRPTGFFRAKAANLQGMAEGVCARFGGRVPSSMAELTSLPGVGRKTANVVRTVAFDLPGLPVDTHVGRLSRRLGLTSATDPERVEHEVGALLPARERGAFSLRLILHGRRVCRARRPACWECVLADFCPSSTLAEAPAARARPRPSPAGRSPTGGPRRPAAARG